MGLYSRASAITAHLQLQLGHKHSTVRRPTNQQSRSRAVAWLINDWDGTGVPRAGSAPFDTKRTTQISSRPFHPRYINSQPSRASPALRRRRRHRAETLEAARALSAAVARSSQPDQGKRRVRADLVLLDLVDYIDAVLLLLVGAVSVCRLCLSLLLSRSQYMRNAQKPCFRFFLFCKELTFSSVI